MHGAVAGKRLVRLPRDDWRQDPASQSGPLAFSAFVVGWHYAGYHIA